MPSRPRPFVRPAGRRTSRDSIPRRVGITDYLSPAEEREGIGLAATTWPEALRKNGYRTALFGKWHLGSQPQFHPTRLGFHRFAGFLGGGTTPMNALLEIDGKPTQTEGPVADVLVDQAIAFVKENRERPFAVCLHFREPHLPYTPVADQDAKLYADLVPEVPKLRGLDVAAVQRSTRDYYASISSVDRNLGRLLGALDELKLFENTLVVFTSDHGYNEGRHYLQTKGNSRWIAGGVTGPTRPNMFDTSIRVPLLVRWPGVVKPGSQIDATVVNVDMFRTVLSALKAPLPENCAAHGVDWSPLLRGESIERREAIFGQYDLHNGGLAYMRMVRTERYKYVRFFKARMMDELYDLKNDSGEERNLLTGRNQTPETAAIADDLQAKMKAWQESIDDPVLKSTY
ncbi:MAG: sulfatase-like hydrolase/transferase [Planctomycetia bacterium]|nr:sulfatase-like hydrolase/transferase [Planctomycetia bacterium]